MNFVIIRQAHPPPLVHTVAFGLVSVWSVAIASPRSSNSDNELYTCTEIRTYSLPSTNLTGTSMRNLCVHAGGGPSMQGGTGACLCTCTSAHAYAHGNDCAHAYVCAGMRALVHKGPMGKKAQGTDSRCNRPRCQQKKRIFV